MTTMLGQGCEKKNLKLNLVWNKKRQARSVLSIPVFWFVSLIGSSSVIFIKWKETENHIIVRGLVPLETDKNMSLYTCVSLRQASPTKYYIVGVILVFPSLILNTVATICRQGGGVSSFQKLPSSGSTWLWRDKTVSLSTTGIYSKSLAN